MITNAHGALNSCNPTKRLKKLKEEKEHILEEIEIKFDRLWIIQNEINNGGA